MALDATILACVALARPGLDAQIDGTPAGGSWTDDAASVRISRLSSARQGEDERRRGFSGADMIERVFGNRTLRLQFSCEANSQTWEDTAEDLAEDLRTGLVRSDVEILLAAENLGVPRCTDVRSISYRDAHGDWRSAAVFEAGFPWSRVHTPAAGTTQDRIGSVEFTGTTDAGTIGPETVTE